MRLYSVLFLILFPLNEAISRKEEETREEKRCTSACKDREAVKRLKIELVRTEILNRLGMTSPPNATGINVRKSKHLVRQFLKRYRHHYGKDDRFQGDDPYGPDESLFARTRFSGFSGTIIDNDEDDHFQAQVINIMASSTVPSYFPEEARSLISKDGNLVYFNLSTEKLRNNWRDLSRADLYLHLPAATDPEDVKTSIRLYYVSFRNESGENAYELSPARSTKVNLRTNKGGWVDLKIYDVVMYWLKYPHLNFGFVVKVSTSKGRKIDALPKENSPIPYLKLDLMDSAINKRRKRTLSKVCNEETDASTTNCCLWPLEVDFHKEYGWEFIIFPSKYEANYCAGDCSIGVTPEYTHTHLMMQNQKSQAGLSPCCTPKKISPVPLMYIDENENVILGKIPNMKVDRCGCA